jgi:hypothetical protein
MNSAIKMIIGSGIPISQSKAPLPKPIIFSSHSITCFTIRRYQEGSVNGTRQKAGMPVKSKRPTSWRRPRTIVVAAFPNGLRRERI